MAPQVAQDLVRAGEKGIKRKARKGETRATDPSEDAVEHGHLTFQRVSGITDEGVLPSISPGEGTGPLRSVGKLVWGKHSLIGAMVNQTRFIPPPLK